MTTRDRLYLYDTTLRDGAQTNGIDFSLEDKILVARLLDDLGVDYVEGGYPGANPMDDAFFSEKRTSRATFTAFGMTKRAGVSVSNDPGVNASLSAASDAVCFVAKSWDYHVDVALKTTLEENLDGIRKTVEAAVAAGKEAMVDCEHFFDGYKANPDYALDCARTAHEAGARWVVLCDTNGGTLPEEVEAIVTEVTKVVPGDHLGIHAHDDTGQAVANSLAAVRAGVRQIQGTLNGIGERCGNANLTTLIPTLMLKPAYANEFEVGVSQAGLKGLTATAHAFDEILNRAPNTHQPYVGAAAFATKAGIHASAILKDPKTYEHVTPDSVGNRRRVLVSDQAGKSNLLAELDRLGVVVDKANPKLDLLLSEVKAREARGFAYEAADASFELLARRTLGTVPTFFEVSSYRVMVERRFNAIGELITVSEAVVKVKIDDETRMSVAEGNGPVNALDSALRKDIGKYQAEIETLELVDFKVRILNGGTGAVTRVLIESMDTRTGRRWMTIGVSENVVDASFEALTDSITYKLLKNGHAGR
ncbi:2-isopropylmalate synthase [Hartmannibacter diazotrophicus]|uniref:Citramalate synthase n=1 Tax=Hartmannibacter diazotrophicus TaxID=1482074 RepID=A0A2C9D6W4_9HYPH|nr:citramalate synthase [Hartmannibacter diazotrophicus]SON55930.1 2-isopropylmalate synthase [Hartmannibacter diazotrophicus]